MAGCGNCGRKIDLVGSQVGRRDLCPDCGAELHACRSCRHFDLSVAKQCKEPFAEIPLDKDSANFCDFFQIGEGRLTAGASRDDLLSAAESLFRKK
jgi:predicted RNA-binding Zn-ribbon protein involved in translation (DUF1610 family)